MYNESYDKFKYDSCVSRGLCSINPRVSALQTVLILYLRQMAKYVIELPISEIEKDVKELILNTIALAIYNTEFNEKSFNETIKHFRKKLPEIMEKYFKLYPDIDIDKEKSKPLELFRETTDVIRAIKYGERIFNRGQENLSSNIRDLYNIMLVIANSISINLLDLYSLEENFEDGFLMILKLLGKINIEEQDVEVLKKDIYDASKINIDLMVLLHKTQEKNFGKQECAEVSYSTIPGKALLVVGNNIKELDIILNKLEEIDVDIYTHDEMMYAHTFPKFKEYKNLKGQFGLGLESCLLDFATFPGPIILTKHSLRNIENLYRGRLFTTDTNQPKGVIKIENNDFTKVIKSIDESRGFKTGKHCETVSIGYDFDEAINLINTKLETGVYNHIFFIGLEDYSFEQKVYYEKLLKITPKNVLIISFSYNNEQENLIHINACFDSFSLIRFFESIKSLDILKTIFLPKCERNSLSQMIYLSNNKKTKVYIGKCVPIILNPTLMNTLTNYFGIKITSSSKKDLENVLNNN